LSLTVLVISLSKIRRIRILESRARFSEADALSPGTNAVCARGTVLLCVLPALLGLTGWLPLVVKLDARLLRCYVKNKFVVDSSCRKSQMMIKEQHGTLHKAPFLHAVQYDVSTRLDYYLF
jgi:hypothetical protein